MPTKKLSRVKRLGHKKRGNAINIVFHILKFIAITSAASVIQDDLVPVAKDILSKLIKELWS